jgi:hypothetical protein
MQRMKRLLLSLIAFALFFIASSRASAAVVRDGTEFSVDLGAAHICWVLPHDLRLASDCDGLSPEAVEAELDKDLHKKPIAMGLVRLERDGEVPRLAVVTVTKVVAFGAVAADNEGAKDYARGAEEELRKDLPIGARLRPSDVHMVKPGVLPLLRATFSIDGIPEASDKKLSEQQIHHAIFTKDGGYVVVWVGRHQDKTRLEKFADASAPTIAVKNPAGSRKQLEKMFEGVFEIIFGVLSLIAIAVGAAIALTRRSRQNQAYAPAYAYPHAPATYGPTPYGPVPYGPAYGPSWGANPSTYPQPNPSAYPQPTSAPSSIPPRPSYEPPRSWWDQR